MSGLEVSGLTINRSEIPIVRDAALFARPGEISVLLGANGAGKTTLLEGLSGVIPVASGSVRLDGEEHVQSRPGKRARAGLAHVEQGRTIFRELTTEENLRVVPESQGRIEDAYRLFPELVQRRTVRAGLLSGGEQQMLVIVRALVSRPKVILIDEMSAGLAPVIVRRLMSAVRNLADTGAAVLLVEQFAALALAIGDRAYVLRRGEIVYDGNCRNLVDTPDRLHALYLGASEAASEGA